MPHSYYFPFTLSLFTLEYCLQFYILFLWQTSPCPSGLYALDILRTCLSSFFLVKLFLWFSRSAVFIWKGSPSLTGYVPLLSSLYRDGRHMFICILPPLLWWLRSLAKTYSRLSLFIGWLAKSTCKTISWHEVSMLPRKHQLSYHLIDITTWCCRYKHIWFKCCRSNPENRSRIRRLNTRITDTFCSL